MELPTLPFGGLIGIGMVISSFFVKGHKDTLLYGGLVVWGYHFIAGISELTDMLQSGNFSFRGRRI